MGTRRCECRNGVGVNTLRNALCGSHAVNVLVKMDSPMRPMAMRARAPQTSSSGVVYWCQKNIAVSSWELQGRVPAQAIT